MDNKIARYMEIERRGLLNRLPEEKQNLWQEYKRRHPELSDNGMQPMSAQQKQQAEDMAAKIRPQKSLGDKTAEFMVTNPFSRQLGFALQGASNAALNPFGYVARAAGVDTEPLEAQNAMERITELAGKYGYDTGAFTSGLTGLAEAGVGGAGLTGNVIKALAAGGQPVAQTGSLGSAALTGFVNPETETGKFATDVLGGMAAAPLGQVVDKSVRSLAPLRKLAKSYLDLNTLTFDPEKNTIRNIGNKLIGKGQNIDDVLNEENQRLARKITRDAKISQARRENAENQISGYVYDTPVIHGGRGVLGRGSGEISPSVDKKSELVPQVDLVKRIKPTEATKRATGNDIAFDEFTPSPENGLRFYKAMSDFKKNAGKIGEQVYLYSPEEYANMRTFLSEDGKTGFALKNDGDIVSVFNGGNSKGAADNIMQAATAAGGTKLDAYDTFLPEIYSRNGFRVNSRDTWNENYKPDKWNKGYMRRFNQGEPDVVYMQYDPNYYGSYESPNSLQNVVNRINAGKDAAAEELNNIWHKRTFNAKKLLDALQTKDGETKISRAIKSGANDLSQDIRELDARIKYNAAGAPDEELDNLFEIPEMTKAKKNYSDFISNNADKSIPEAVMNDYYKQNPLAVPYLKQARQVNPTDFKDLLPNGIVENDKLKQGMRLKRTKNVNTIGSSAAKGYENAENALKNLMEKYYPGFRSVNTEYAKASTKQGSYSTRAKSAISRLANGTANEVLTALVNTLMSGAALGTLAFNKSIAAVPIATGGGNALLRSHFRNSGRKLAYDKAAKLPVYLSELARAIERNKTEKIKNEIEEEN